MTAAPMTGYGPRSAEIAFELAQLEHGGLTPDDMTVLQAAHRLQWAYGEGEPAAHPQRVAAWWALRSALDQAGRVPFPSLGPAWRDARAAVLAAGAGRVLWPVLDVVMAHVAADLVGTVPGWNGPAYDALTSPWFAAFQSLEELADCDRGELSELDARLKLARISLNRWRRLGLAGAWDGAVES